MNSSAEQLVVDGMQIRDLQPQDRAAWESLYRQYAEFYKEPMNEDILARTWSWLLDAQHPLQGKVVATANGALLGLAHYRPFPEPLLGKDAGFLDDLFVSPDQRGSGLGRRLIEAVAQAGKEQGWPFLRWITAQDNVQARRLYDGLTQATAWVTYDLNL
ncbi:GNAT family N-acetyltransferase [Alcaligenes sp. 1735tsa3]|uniref:GNAT family N-acetyltransferase n=1 Tax=Alcaligenes sp. 1735tsa3 TaxID=2953809 RepID=UPI0020A7DC59|nr:GNAT family N-acetyltransferase [Alcaligenes sp. 1735tsa3]USY25289.1 GNAT family N-acetyltransferase [Alcaligenes sp. 1735tsa3]